MDTANTKYINQLVNAHKVSAFLVPLVEAMEINKRTSGVDNLSLPDMLKTVIETGGEVYQEILDEEALVDTGLIPDKLFQVLAKTLRNNVVLYNSASLALIKDDMVKMFTKNIDFLQKYQNLGFEKNTGGKSTPSRVDAIIERQHSMGHAVSALSQMFMPVWIFHTNLYTSAFIDEDKMADLNMEVSSYLVNILDVFMKKMESSQSKYFNDFQINSLFLCAEMIANLMHDYNGKIIKNKESLNEYIESPIELISELVPAMYANFSALNKAAEGALSGLLSR
jgi:hypothetical protein